MTKIKVYIDDGRIFEYEITDENTVREHMGAIMKTGYRHVPKSDSSLLEWYPVHRIFKVKAIGLGNRSFSYQDTTSET